MEECTGIVVISHQFEHSIQKIFTDECKVESVKCSCACVQHLDGMVGGCVPFRGGVSFRTFMQAAI